MANGTAEYQAYELPKGYEPTALDITSGRGKSQYNHEGNVAFRMILQDNIPRYKSSRSKSGKTLVIAGIMEEKEEEVGSSNKEHSELHLEEGVYSSSD